MKSNNHMVINEHQTIEGIQKSFNSIFPFLKLEFFNEDFGKRNSIEKKKMHVGNKNISYIQRIRKSGKVSISGDLTVGELERNLSKNYGLFAQVFRKSGNVWLETTVTDSWTLEQQNEEGKNLAEHLKIDNENLDDHDVW